MHDDLDIDKYFKRIGFQGKVAPCEETLHGISKAHTLTIPFENFDVFFGRPILLDLPALFYKLVTCKRGGYCFEMNGLMAAVLEKTGFKVVPLLARVSIDFKRQFGAKTHQVLLVETGRTRWLVDVGFGKDGIITPLLLDTTRDQYQFGRTYCITPHSEFGYILDMKTLNGVFCQYAFTLERCWPSDFIMANHYTATFPKSPFVNTLICTKPTLQGRITLTDHHLKIVSNGEVQQIAVDGMADFNKKLATHFNLDLKKIHKLPLSTI